MENVETGWLVWFAAGYLAIGGLFGFAMMQAIPAMNLLGGAYIALAWPVLVACNYSDLCSGVPPLAVTQYFFTF